LTVVVSFTPEYKTIRDHLLSKDISDSVRSLHNNQKRHVRFHVIKLSRNTTCNESGSYREKTSLVNDKSFCKIKGDTAWDLSNSNID